MYRFSQVADSPPGASVQLVMTTKRTDDRRAGDSLSCGTMGHRYTPISDFQVYGYRKTIFIRGHSR